MRSPGHIVEIDTLRAVSVLLVLLFHTVPGAVPGGFLGVDVFFVISGFVISRSYLFDLVERRRTLRSFYIARIRRLAPALLLVLGLTTVAAVAVLPPDRLIAYAWSLAAQPLYLQNVTFWLEGDYFAGPLTKPLLHTWSLAVEEQFYVCWALAILAFRRYPKAILATVIVLGGLSFLTGMLLEVRSPKTVFFLLPTRVWQFAIGILAYLACQRIGRISASLAGTLAGACLVVIVLTAVFTDESGGFPGIPSVLVCAAAGIALVCLDRKIAPVRLLCLTPLLFVGRISYGLYLWHWPPLVLFFLQMGRAADPLEASLLMVLATVGASLSFFLLEDPIRRGRWLASARALLRGYGTASLLLLVSGAAMVGSSGLAFRYPAELRPFFAAVSLDYGFRCGKVYVLRHPSSELCPLSPSRAGVSGVLILGDSQADMLHELLGEIGADEGIPTYLTVRNCDLGRYGQLPFCARAVLTRITAEAQGLGISDVLVISDWRADVFEAAGIETDIAVLVQAGLRVHLMQVVPSDASYGPRDRAMQALGGAPLRLDGMSLTEYRETTSETRRMFLQAMSRFPGHVFLLSPSDYFCSDGACAFQQGGMPYFQDANHVTRSGAEVLRPMFERVFRTIKESPP